MAFCKNCGLELEHGVRFCPSCGTRVDGSDSKIDGSILFDEPEKTNPRSKEDKIKADIEKNRLVATICYIYILFFLPLIYDKNSDFGRFHANQALVLLLFEIVVGICSSLIGWLLFGLGMILTSACGIFGFVLLILGMVNAYKGKMEELPIIGKIRILK